MAGTPKDYGTIAAEFEERPVPDGAVLVNAWSRETNQPLKFYDLNAKIHEIADQGHKHIVVTLSEPLPIQQRIYYQALLGSDQKRELLSSVTVKRGTSVEYVSILFRPRTEEAKNEPF